MPSQRCLTFSYPYCAVGNKALVAKYYIAARTCDDKIESFNSVDWFAISCAGVGNNWVDSAISKKGWYVSISHEVNDNWLQGHFDYLRAKGNRVWVATFADVARYIRERQSLTVTQKSLTSDSIVVRVTDTLPNVPYNVPVTLRTPLPAGWTVCSVMQNGKVRSDTLVMAEGRLCVQFDAVPDDGDVVLYKAVMVPVSRHARPPNGSNAYLTYANSMVIASLPSLADNAVSLSIFDTQGKLVTRGIRSCDLHGRAQGTYIVRMTESASTGTKHIAHTKRQ